MSDSKKADWQACDYCDLLFMGEQIRNVEEGAIKLCDSCLIKGIECMKEFQRNNKRAAKLKTVKGF